MSREAKTATALKLAAADHYGECAAEYLLEKMEAYELEQDYIEYTNLEFFYAIANNWKPKP